MTVDRYGVMGYPVSHSRSPVIHRLFAQQTAQDIQYELLRVAPEKLEQAVRQFQTDSGHPNTDGVVGQGTWDLLMGEPLHRK